MPHSQFKSPNFYNSFAPLSLFDSTELQDMSPSTPSTSRLSNTAPEAKSNPAVSPQPNRKNGAGTPARPMVSPIAISAEHPRQFQQHVYMLVDGDKYIFQRSWVDQGREGGRRASTAITESVHKYYNRSTNYKLWIYLFFNLKGQISTLASDGYNLRHFGDFLHGFQAPGMNFVVDTGRRKESADTKLKEMFQAYIRSPETKGIFLAVCHDGGYAETIDRELIPDFRSKIIRVKSGYVAQDIWALTNLPDIPPNFFTEGLFIKNPWPSSNDNGRNSVDKGRNRFTPWTAMRRDNSRPQSRLSTYTQEDRSPAPSPLCYTPETLVGELPSHFPQVLYWEPQKDDYPGVDCILDPINTCRYISRPSPGFETAPDLNLQVGPHPDSESPDAGTIARFRAHIERSSPCPGGAQCSRFGCPWAHVCPYGPCCELLRNGHCNFAQDMHNNLKEIASSLGATQKALADDTMQTREFRKILQRMISRIDSSKLAPRHP
ncbi:hypothetical protein DFP72DRAFT_38414 [Ephemerocybe angulata]|uniref:Uncharacterized protein n=1 Tax=Ephemerocybe angulata TaxID=980116 RepID=A0A8H6IBV4_9AGAR|nr:hypothetical protein DFP72DRAFT_38414 [Tulosesus angulatus]